MAYTMLALRHTVTSISANADGPRDAASHKVDHFALPTSNYQATSVGQQQIAAQTENCRLLPHI